MSPLEVGLLFWAGGELGEEKSPADIVESVIALGVNCGQLGLHGEADLGQDSQAQWQAAFSENDLAVVTAVVSFSGESYSDVEAVERTVGYMPPATRAEREQRTFDVSDFAAGLGIPGLATHIGALPDDRSDEEYVALRDLVRRICDRCAGHSQSFALETGQESAEALRRFIIDVDRPNLGVNFDPANMVLYGSGEPMRALETVREWVISVHCKDGVGPSAPGTLGTETPLGAGDVGMQPYVGKLREIGYTGPLVIEREIVGEAQRADIREAVALLNRLRQCV
jgi:sugar phosphate isomerase/epimerase